MAGCFDSSWRVGSKARGTRSPFKLATEGLLPFKCTFPVHLTSVMDRVPSPQSDLHRGETRTRTVREYEETIEELKKENFDLKLRRFLLEESLQKYLQKNKDSNSVQIVVELSHEAHSLKGELANKEQRLQEALEQVEKYASDLNELQSEFEELQEQLKCTSENRLEVQLKDDKEHFEKEAERLKEVLKEKDHIIQNANAQIEELTKQNEILVEKTKKKSAALQGIVYKYHKEGEMIPRDLRPIVQKAVQAAKECDQEMLNATLGELKASFIKIMPSHVKDFSSSQLRKENEDPSKAKTSVTDLKKFPEASQSARDLSFMPTDSKMKFVHEHGEQSPTRAKTWSQSSESVRSTDSEEAENIERMMQALTDNENLKADNEEKARTIKDLNSSCSELERRSIQLQSDLIEALSKVKKLEMKIQEERSRDKSTSSELSDSFLQIVGQSNSVDKLKEEIYRLLLIIQQKDKELSDNEREHGSLQTQFKEMESPEERLERDYLQGRLALSCQVNHDLMEHLRKLETFMEDLLLHKDLDSSSIENISEASDVFSRLTTCLDETKKLSSALSEHLSVCENSKLFESSDISLRRGYSQSGRQSYSEDQPRLAETSNANYTSQGRNTFFQSESSKPTAGTGKRRLSFSTLHNAKSVVLGTSNNEDLILLLNDRGDPEDVLIRNNDNPSTHPYLDSSMGFWKSPEMGSPKVRCCPSSDSDIWSEPDRDVSMQRIGIDVQRSPVSLKSPRRLRLRDKRATDELSSQKNESSSSTAKFHPWSKRRRSIETLKSPFVCKKCLSQSPSKDESAEKEKFQKVVSDLSNRCTKQENQLDEMREILSNKIKENDQLTKEKLKLSNSIDALEKELKELKIKKEDLSLQSSESSGKLTEVSYENIKLRKSIERLESKATESDSVCKKLKEELEETKARLQSLDKKCSEYELDLASSLKTSKDYNEKYNHELNEKNRLLTSIHELVSKKDELLESIQLEKKKILQFERENSELKGKLQENSQSFISLQSKYSELENKSKEQLKESQESVAQEKNELLQSIRSKENKIQQLEHENNELKRKLQEDSKSFISLQSKYSELENKSNEQMKKSQESVVQEKNQLLSIRSKENKIQQLEHENGELKRKLQENSQSLEQLKKSQESVVQEKNELLQSIRSKENKIQQLEHEDGELKRKLQENSQSFISQQSKYSELENKSKEQLKKSQESVAQEKNELLQSIRSRENKIQQLEHENVELKRKHQKNIQSFISQQSKYSELENKLKEQLKISQESVAQEKNELLSIHSKENKIQQFEHENGELKKKLQENSHSFISQQSKYPELENKSKEQVKKSQESYENLKQSCTTFERELQESSKVTENIRESLLKVKNLCLDNLRNLSVVCKQYLNCEDERCKDIDNYLYERLTTFANDDKIKELFTDINTVSSKFKQIIEFLSDQLRSVSFDQHKFDMNKREIETLQNLNCQLNVKINSLQLAENESKSVTQESKSQIEFLQQDLMKAREEIKAKESYINKLQAHVETVQQSYKEIEKPLEQSKHMLSASELKVKTLQEKIKEDQKLLDLKDEQISVWQNSALKAGLRLSDSSMEKSPNVSKEPKTSITREMSDVRGSSESIATSFSSITSAKDEESIMNVDQYKKKIKSLKLKLVMYEKRIEILEQEKSDLRKELLEQVKRSQSSEEVDNLRKELADKRGKLEAKTSFIEDLKKDMFKTCNSLVDKQKEVDDLRHKLSDSKAQCTELKLRGKDGSLKFRFSDPRHSNTEANIKTLKRQKWELIQSILDQQKQFYERKNIHLGHLVKFKTRIERLQAAQASPTMFKSDSEPFLNSPSTESNCLTGKCDETSTNLQGQLELDIEWLQNFSVFLKRFFIPLVLQSCENCTKNIDSSPKHSSKDIENSASSPAKILHDNMSDRESLSEENINLSRSGSVSPMSFEGNLPFQSSKNGLERSQVPTSRKSGKDNYSELSHKLSNVVEGSQESIFNRSHFSSPDLGIESDPNHESSAPEKDEPGESRLSRRHESLTKVKGWSPEKQVPESAHGIPAKLQDHEPFSGRDSLHAICTLPNYELLKKEVQESFALIKNIIIRTKDGLQRTTRFASPQKNLEYVTFKAIKDTSGDIEVCLEQARNLVETFWIAPCPSEQELKMLIQQSQEQQEEIRRIRESKVKQEKYYDEALARVKQAEIEKDKMEKKISKRLVSTKNVIRRAEMKLLEQGSHDQSPLPEYPRKD